MAEENRPFIGYRSAGRRPESQQDRRAAADAPLSALRGMVSGVLGAPGDIESLVRMLPGLSERTVLPTSEDIERRLPMRELNQTPTGKAFTTAGQLGGGFYTGPGSPLRAVAALPSAVSRAGRDFLMSTSPVNVVKPKGGNWMSGSVERVVNPMQQTVLNETGLQNLAERAGVDVSESVRARQLPEAAMNRWLETKLGKYIKNEMATPEDPVRSLAERGVLHVEPEQLNFRQEMHGRYMEPGQTAVAQSPAAKSWEGASDMQVGQMPAGQLLQQGYAEQMPWLAKVPPETPVYMPSQSGMADDLGFGHLVDELRNAVNPESGLPANLRLKYQDLEKVTVPQAVERVAKINDWRAAQKAEADLARAMGPATQVVKEYPEQGFKWVELRQPKEAAEGWSIQPSTLQEGAFDVVDPRGQRSFGGDSIELAQSRLVEKGGVSALEDALKYEGETMGHCVGGYCPDVVEGRSKIYSLRDKKGQPHVTIEVAPKPLKTWRDVTAAVGPDESGKLYDEFDKIGGFNMDDTDAAFEMFIKNKGIKAPDDIVQIKGKGNKAPKEDYLPAVQDFVRSGNFGKIGDLQNTGLVKFGDEYRTPSELLYKTDEGDWINLQDAAKQYFPDSPTKQQNFIQGAADPSLWGSYLKLAPPPEGFSRGGQVHGYQAGGAVRAAKATAKSIGDLVEKYTPEFKQWFAGSKAATPEGEPLRVFRGSARDEGEVLKNSWFTSDPKAASTFSMKGAHMKKDAAGKEEYVLPNSVVTPAYLSMKRPFVIDAKGADWNRIPFGDPRDKFFMSTDEIADFARDEKYDGVIFKNVNESDLHVDLDPIDVYATFKPEQVKSTFNKKPTSDPRVGYAEGGEVSGANFPTDDFDPARIDAIVGELHALNAG